MKLNLQIEFACLPFAILFYIYHLLFYRDSSNVTRKFRGLIVIDIICIFTDIITGHWINEAQHIPVLVNTIANNLFYMFCAFGIYYGSTYVDALLEERTGKKKTVTVDIFLLVIYCIIMTINIFTGIIFHFDETGYVHAAFYPFGAMYILFMELIVLVRISLNLKNMRLQNVAAIYTSYVIMLLQCIDQIFIHPDVLRAGFCGTICIVAILLAMETPEYTRLIDLKKNYNEKLERESETQTQLALEAQNGIILGMADLLEDRDPQTAGHIARSTKVVQLMVQCMLHETERHTQQSLLENIVKAAPLHDLGKLTLKNHILQKDGKYSEQEYSIMKEHVLSGGDILKQVLKDCPDKQLVETAVNMTLYHHERYDGTGYPEGLKGENIPLEARIMAVADVFDALLTKRSYKTENTFEEAMKIMEESFGTLFDPQLKPYFMDCQTQLQQFYSGRDLV